MARKQALSAKIGQSDAENEPKSAKKQNSDIRVHPRCKWTEERINKAIDEFLVKNGRLPSSKEFGKNGLPYIEIFDYRFQTTYTAWMKQFYPTEYAQGTSIHKCAKGASLEEFIAEYNRLKPFSKTDFNARRNRKLICCIQTIMRRNGISRWEKLLSVCGLTPYKKSKQKIITEIEVEIR